MANILGGALYNNPDYKNLMNDLYYPIENMRKTVERLKASPDIDLETLQYGQYQPILVPRDRWPHKGGQAWLREMGQVRIHLGEQLNNELLDGAVPLTRCGLMDASLRKCFNSDPPICIRIDVWEHKKDDPKADTHEVSLVWEYANGHDKPPTLLKFSMICPFRSLRTERSR